MKKALFYSLLVFLISCNQINNTKVSTQTEETFKKDNTTTSSISKKHVGPELKITFTSTQNTNNETSRFTGNCSLRTQPFAEINMGLHFEKSGNHIDDTLNSRMFSKFMDLNDIERIQIDSLYYTEDNNKVNLNFVVSLNRVENDKLKIVDKYSMVYSSDFENKQPELTVKRITKSTTETIFE